MTFSGWGVSNRRNGEFSTGVDTGRFHWRPSLCTIEYSWFARSTALGSKVLPGLRGFLVSDCKCTLRLAAELR